MNIKIIPKRHGQTYCIDGVKLTEAELIEAARAMLALEAAVICGDVAIRERDGYWSVEHAGGCTLAGAILKHQERLKGTP